MATSVDAKLLKATKFPPEFNQKVDMEKVNLEVMKKWIAGRISEILGNDDDVVIELCFNLIEGSRFPDVKKMQIQLTGFLDKDTASFCKELWKLCLSAQSNAQGVPKELLEAKKLELLQEKIEAEKAAEETRRRREEEQRRERETNNVRTRDRFERGRGAGRGDSWRGGRGDDRHRDFERGGGRGFDHRGPTRYSRSPPPRRRDSRDRGSFRGPPIRDSDTYVPNARGGRRRDDRRRHSTSPSVTSGSEASRARSRSPLRRRPRSSSRSRSPPRRRRSRSGERRGNKYRRWENRGRERSPDRGTRRRSPSPLDSSPSRSPRPLKRYRSTSISISPSPPPKSRRSRNRRSTRSRSESSSPSRSITRAPIESDSRSTKRAGTTPTADDDINVAPRHRDARRLTRSNSRSITPPRRRHRSSPRNTSRDGNDRKRRQSLQRYEPVYKRRRNSSSVSSPVGTRGRKADTEDESDRGSPMREIEVSKSSAESNEIQNPQKQTTELREKLLREKIKKMRTSSIDSTDAHS